MIGPVAPAAAPEGGELTLVQSPGWRPGTSPPDGLPLWCGEALLASSSGFVAGVIGAPPARGRWWARTSTTSAGVKVGHC